jgi:endonuclease III
VRWRGFSGFRGRGISNHRVRKRPDGRFQRNYTGSIEPANLDSTLDHAVCYRAVASRDPRFDGRFFTAVLSTGIYCRPICPARTPRSRNCRFYSCAAAAEEAGFRPCRRCRPDTAPGSPIWRGAATTVSRARAIQGLATVLRDGGLRLDAAADPAEVVAQLESLPGIGTWTAQYIAMRALADPDAFPSTDLGLRRALGDGDSPARPREVVEQAERWRPWRAYAVLHLWHDEG